MSAQPKELVRTMTQIVIIEDEMSIADALVFALETDGWRVRWVRLGQEGIDAALEPSVELVVLDVGLPDMSGFDVCKAIRKRSEVPILFLTARGDEIDRIVGLEIGADDYVVKPFSPREIATRVRVILKRFRGPRLLEGATRAAVETTDERVVPPRVVDEEFAVSWETLTITYCARALQLTAQEFRLLAHLATHPERVFSRVQLLEVVGAGTDAVYERNIDTHVKALRFKLREVNNTRDPIQTHRGFGYSYRPGRGDR
jgi:two-component system, OmpR family, catabolic regulation response regulator CreB